MTYKLITINNYLLSVTQYRKRGWFYCVRTKSFFHDEGEDVLCCNGDLSVVAHLPLNGADVINNLPLLPPLEEDDVEKLAINEVGVDGEIYNEYDCETFIKGYNKAKEKYKYTDEDIDKAYWAGMQFVGEDKGSYKEFIQSLSQPKMPTGFECVTETRVFDTYPEKRNINPKTTTTPEGHTQWAGKYIYE